MTNFFSQPAYEAITVNPPGPSAAKDEKKIRKQVKANMDKIKKYICWSNHSIDTLHCLAVQTNN